MARAILICEQRARLMREQCRQPNEAQSRQYLGREALELGRGGPTAVARAADVETHRN